MDQNRAPGVGPRQAASSGPRIRLAADQAGGAARRFGRLRRTGTPARRSRTQAPWTLAAVAKMASITSSRVPSLKFGTHSTSADDVEVPERLTMGWGRPY